MLIYFVSEPNGAYLKQQAAISGRHSGAPLSGIHVLNLDSGQKHAGMTFYLVYTALRVIPFVSEPYSV
jgi:hypothetical protein